MEINLTKIWQTITSPFVWLFQQLKSLYQAADRWLNGRAHSRRSQAWRDVVLQRRNSSASLPRNSRLSSAQQQLKRIKILRLIAIGLFVLVILSVVGFFGAFAYFSRDLPQPGQVVRRDGFSTKIYDRNGKLLYDLFDEERRTPVKLDAVPAAMRNATVAIEDKDFYKHRGFDFLTALRIPYNVIARRRLVGGSTLTQQLVKNVLLTNERTISRKFKELVLAIQIERTFSKDQILEMYLNEVPYGGTAWGVASAAELYFNKPVQELSLLESAFLAGLPQRPSIYSPFSGKTDKDGQPLWQIRTRAVLSAMLDQNFISTEEYNQAIEDLPNLEFDKGTLEIRAPHFVFYVKERLTEMYGEGLVEQGGLKVVTTLDLDLQEKAQQIVAEEVEAVEDYHITNGASLIMDPRTGEIIAMVGSRDYFDNENGGQFNVVTDGLRQPGSSIKPVTYLALLRQGYTPASMLVDAPTNFKRNANDRDYTPRNYNGTFQGPVSVRNALGSSLNIPAVKALALVGIEDFLDLAYSMGFESLAPTQENLQRFGLALTLGGGEVRLIDTVSAYSAFANGGTKIDPVAILSVEDRDGKKIYEHRPVSGSQVMSEGEAFLINDILSDNNARLLAFGANSLLNTGRPIAVKTGTTNDMIDNWTIGWSQEIIVGSWVGNNDNSSMKRVASGVTGASPIWRKTMMAALEAGYGAPPFEKPDEVEQVEVDSISGYPAHDDFPSRTDYAIRGTLPSLPDPIHKKVKVCKGENKLATEARIARGDYEKREVIDLRRDDPLSEDGVNRWMEGIQQWIDSQDDSRYDVPTEYCGDEDEVSVRLERPEDKKSYDEEEIEVRVRAGSNYGIEKIQIWTNGDLREEIKSSNYEGKIKLKAGQHELWAVAYSRNDKKVESDKVRIGTGGEPWEAPEPTATPEPTKKPEPTPEPTQEEEEPEPTVTSEPEETD
jgi:1A family penicillin-binding protein